MKHSEVKGNLLSDLLFLNPGDYPFEWHESVCKGLIQMQERTKILEKKWFSQVEGIELPRAIYYIHELSFDPVEVKCVAWFINVYSPLLPFASDKTCSAWHLIPSSATSLSQQFISYLR